MLMLSPGTTLRRHEPGRHHPPLHEFQRSEVEKKLLVDTLAGLTALETLWMPAARLDSLDGAEDMSSLMSLDVSFNNVRDLRPL